MAVKSLQNEVVFNFKVDFVSEVSFTFEVVFFFEVVFIIFSVHTWQFRFCVVFICGVVFIFEVVFWVSFIPEVGLIFEVVFILRLFKPATGMVRLIKESEVTSDFSKIFTLYENSNIIIDELHMWYVPLHLKHVLYCCC